jgi:hypothetical protein
MVLVQLSGPNGRLPFLCKTRHFDDDGTTQQLRSELVTHAHRGAGLDHVAVHAHAAETAGPLRQGPRLEEPSRAQPAIHSDRLLRDHFPVAQPYAFTASGRPPRKPLRAAGGGVQQGAPRTGAERTWVREPRKRRRNAAGGADRGAC